MMNFREHPAPWRRLDFPTTVISPAISPAPRDAWEVVLRSDPNALESQSPAWTDAACATGSFEDASRLYETVDGRLLVLPMLRRRHMIGALSVEASNPPGWGVGGLLAPGSPTPAEVATVFSELAARRVLTQRLWPNPLAAAAWEAGAPVKAKATERVAHLIDLGGGFDHVWSKLAQKSSRRGARHAEREGVTVECDNTGRLIPEFYGLHCQAVNRWSHLQHEPEWMALRRHRRNDPPEKFDAIAHCLGERCQVWVARIGRTPIASMIVLQGNNAYDFRAAMNEDYTSYRANDLLLRLAISDACRAGCGFYYLGDSGHSVTLARFKERFGARPYDYAEYLLERLPISTAERSLKRAVKRAVGFRDSGLIG
jgi:Acetyltransferase (GNAT) domain